MKAKPNKEVPERKKCLKCSKERHMKNDFYLSYSKLHADGRVPICKRCISEMVDVRNLDTVKNTLRMMDRPFIDILWKKSIESEMEPFGVYLKNIALPQNRELTWDDSKDKIPASEFRKAIGQASIDDIDEMSTEDGDLIKVTHEVMLKFGADYTNREYLEMEKFYRDMMDTHVIVTPPHKQLLINLCKLNIEMDRLLGNKDYPNYDKLAKQYESMLKSAGFRPADRKSGDEESGFRSFSAVWEEVEKDGFVEPHDISTTQDIVDHTIMYIGNFTLKLLGHGMMATPPSDTPLVDLIEEEDVVVQDG